MKQILYTKTRGVRNLYKRVPVHSYDGPMGSSTVGYTSEPNGTEEYYFETRIDLNALQGMGEKAARNGTGIC